MAEDSQYRQASGGLMGECSPAAVVDCYYGTESMEWPTKLPIATEWRCRAPNRAPRKPAMKFNHACRRRSQHSIAQIKNGMANGATTGSGVPLKDGLCRHESSTKGQKKKRSVRSKGDPGTAPHARCAARQMNKMQMSELRSIRCRHP